jgi:hypothetical protein
MDFTTSKYKVLLETLRDHGYRFQTFKEYLETPKEKCIILRHDVDLLPSNSLVFAKIQANYNIKGTYYFRTIPKSRDDKIMKEIHELGHEIGYHYESLTSQKGNYKKAILDFAKNLKELRKIVPISTICMHGDPFSKYDNRDLWKYYSYQDFGIIGEPYINLNFNKVFYLTDTGRRWDGKKVSVIDKVNSGFNYSFHKTNDIITAARANQLPKQMMFTFHPQRWTDNRFLWTKEFFLQNIKNLVKRFIAK